MLTLMSRIYVERAGMNVCPSKCRQSTLNFPDKLNLDAIDLVHGIFL